MAWNEFASRSFSRPVITLFNFYISFFWPNSSFYFSLTIFYLFKISSDTFLLLASALSNYFLYISLSRLSFSMKLRSLTELFFSSLISDSNWTSPFLIVSFIFSSCSRSLLTSSIYLYNFLAISWRPSCLWYSRLRLSWILANSFSLTDLSSIRLWLISLISSYFLSSTASSFSNFFSIFLFFSILSSISWRDAEISLNLMLDSLLFSLKVISLFFAPSN